MLAAGGCGTDEDTAIGPGAPSPSSSAPVSTEPAATCSAAGHRPRPPAGELPEPVARTRTAIRDAASACDLDRLAAIGDPKVSFGDDTDAAAFWRHAEQAGDEPLHHLVTLLELPPARTAEGRYVWPAAFARESWAATPPRERDELRALYDDDDLAGFADFGAYLGWRVGIEANGTWSFFVSGD